MYAFLMLNPGKLARDTLGGSVTLEKTACINMV